MNSSSNQGKLFKQVQLNLAQGGEKFTLWSPEEIVRKMPQSEVEAELEGGKR